MSEPEPLTTADIEPIIQRLDAVIGLLARVQPRSERATLTERIHLLVDLGLDNTTIGRIVGRSGNYVGVIRRRPRAGGTRKKGKTNANGKTSRARSGRRRT